jgi:hypothetical protein
MIERLIDGDPAAGAACYVLAEDTPEVSLGNVVRLQGRWEYRVCIEESERTSLSQASRDLYNSPWSYPTLQDAPDRRPGARASSARLRQQHHADRTMTSTCI